jgi:hypothetical protein
MGAGMNHDFALYNGFSDTTPKTQRQKKKITGTSSKLKNFYASEDTIKKIEKTIHRIQICPLHQSYLT